MSSLIFILQQAFLFFIPLMIVALGAMFSEQSGVMNIGLEGIMIIGAFSGIMAINALEGSLPPQALLFCGVLVSMLAGIVFTFFHAFASITLKADQTISGTVTPPEGWAVVPRKTLRLPFTITETFVPERPIISRKP